METQAVISHIVNWLIDYTKSAKTKGFIVGISGGVDSALVAHLCAKTELDVLLLNMPIRQHQEEYQRAIEQIQALEKAYQNVRSVEIDLTSNFELLSKTFDHSVANNDLVMANTRSRLRMLTLYAYGQQNNLLVAGTGNKVEDFGIGFFTKYGDGGVDISPIGDLMKTEVYTLAEEIGVVTSILTAKPTDGLWEQSNRTDEDQIGATYPELEWAMNFVGNESELSDRQKEVLNIYNRFHTVNQHKMRAIPVCKIPRG